MGTRTRCARRRRWPRSILATLVSGAAVAGLAAAPAQAAPARPADHGSGPGSPVADWIRRAAAPLARLDPAAPLDDLASLKRGVGTAEIVGLGEATHGASEVFQLKHRVLRVLVEELGFRSIAWEEDWTLGLLLDDYIRTGKGDLDALVGQMSTTWRSAEVRAVLTWLRDYNASRADPADKVRFVGVEFFATRGLAYDAVESYVTRTAPHRLAELRRHLKPIRPATENIGEHVGWYFGVEDKRPYIRHARGTYELVERLPHRPGDAAHELALQHARQILSFYEYFDRTDGLSYRDARAAENLRWWHRRTGDKIAYWAASAHTADAAGLRIFWPPEPPVRFDNAGSHLRDWYGRRYLSVGFTFDHGAVQSGFGAPPYTPRPFPVVRPPLDFAERPLGDAGPAQFTVDLRAAKAPPEVRAWLRSPAKTRVIGPVYDPDNTSAYHMTGGSLAGWFDILVHRQEVTPWRPR